MMKRLPMPVDSTLQIVHILQEGCVLCGFPGIPGAWPEGHRWVASDDPNVEKLVTCLMCRQIHVECRQIEQYLPNT
jgi:hypothetical protein